MYAMKIFNIFDACEILRIFSVKKVTLPGAAIVQKYYDLLRTNEVQKVTVQDKIIKYKRKPKDIKMTIVKQREGRNKGFMFNIPTTFYKLFKTYLGELC